MLTLSSMSRYSSSIIFLFVTILGSDQLFSTGFVIPGSLPSSTSWSSTGNYGHSSESCSPANGAGRISALNVWSFGGIEGNISGSNDDESCELVAVRIEKTSANSRRIAGDITVPAPMKDVWAILTDYDRLSAHVPNLVESRVVGSSGSGRTTAGDGSHRCRLFQKGAQKIIGFDFSATVTMDMSEQITRSNLGEERRIHFKCADSFFFSVFDGDWRVKEQLNRETGEVESIVTYVVDVRPKGPVPVAALEWRIREDVPSNLRAVKKTAVTVGERGVLAYRERQISRSSRRQESGLASQPPRSLSQPQSRRFRQQHLLQPSGSANASPRRAASRRVAQPQMRMQSQRVASSVRDTGKIAARSVRNTIKNAVVDKIKQNSGKTKLVPIGLDWDTDETMEAYLRE